MISKYNFKALLLTVGILASATVAAQTTRTDYFMKSSYLRTDLNPALRPNHGYLIIPLLPNVGVSAQTNTLNMDNLTYKLPSGKRGTFLHKDVTASEFLANMKDKNFLEGDVNIKLLGAGFYKGEGFWQFDLGLKTHVDANVPKDFFRLMKEGFSQDGVSKFDFKDLSATGSSFAEVGAGYSRPLLNNTLVLGVKGKLLLGIADFDLDAKNFEIETTRDTWRAKSHIVLQGSGPGLNVKNKVNADGDVVFDEFEFKNFGIPGYGFGADLGAEYNLGKILRLPTDLKISGAITDLGFISWNKNSSSNLSSRETEVIVDSKDFVIGGTDENGNSNGSTLVDAFDKAIKKLEEAVELRGENKERTTSLRSTVTFGAEYEILPKKLTAGVVYSNRFNRYFNTSELTASLNLAPCSWFSASAGYSFINTSYDTFGLALHLTPSKGVRFFVASDYALVHHNSTFLPTRSKGVNGQIGFSIPLGKSRYKKADIESLNSIDLPKPENMPKVEEAAKKVEEVKAVEEAVKEESK